MNARAASIWVVMPAAGRGSRFGGDIPKQYLRIDGRTVVAHALGAAMAHPRVAGAMVALAAGDAHWADARVHDGRVHTCIGGGERADSVLAALRALPAGLDDDTLVLVHDAARPHLHPDDLARLIDAADVDPHGAILAAPVRDTLKRAVEAGTPRIAATESRERLWRALTPQAFRRGALTAALERARADGVVVTDEAMAMERTGAAPRLVEGREDNLKITTRADLALATFLLTRRESP